MLKSILTHDYKMSQRLLRTLVREGGIERNGKTMYLTSRVQMGDKINVMLPRESPSVTPERMDMDVRYEDDEILVVNKPPGILTHPSARERKHTLLAGVQNKLLQTAEVPHCVHRLDRDTSGLVMFAKHAHAHHLFDLALRNGQMHRSYCAIVMIPAGSRPEALSGDPHAEGWSTIDLSIGQNAAMPSRRVIDEDGKEAVTHFRVLGSTDTAAFVQIRLETGRTHQIRLHFAAVGMPLVGDRDYTGATVGKVSREETAPLRTSVQVEIDRQALHAYRLSWQHPVTSEQYHATAEPPDDIRKAWRQLGGSDDVFQTLAIQRG